jgi:sialate O-acetylesterase
LPAGAFRASAIARQDWLTSQVPEAKEYQLVYDLDLARLGPAIQYDVDNHRNLRKSFDRIAYFVELQDGNGRFQDVFVSMDAFTDDAGKIAVPTVASGAAFQQNVSNLNVYSNVKGIVNGTKLQGGNIEFWPNNYTQANAANVPNASGDVYDFGDQRVEPVEGYGSIQVHNHDARQTLFAINHWREGAHADVGIGNQPKDSPDWTFTGNAGSYRAMRLKVFVKYRQ